MGGGKFALIGQRLLLYNHGVDHRFYLVEAGAKYKEEIDNKVIIWENE